MKIERTKNTISGFAWGATGKIVNMFIPFILRTVMIYKLGVEYLGLSSLFASVLQVLSMSELGFSYACVYAMYKPIAEDDYKTVGSILIYLKKIYFIIGMVLLVIGSTFTPFLKYIINGDIPNDVNIYILYGIYLINSSLSYFFFAYKSSLLSALQCNNIINKVGLLTNTFLKVGQCVVLLIIPNYYVYVVLIPLTTLLNNLIKSHIVNQKFSCYLVKEPIEDSIRNDIKQKIVPLIGIKISTVLINAADTLVISTFLGLKETALYNNYFFIMSSVQAIVYEIHSSMLAGVGNSLVVDNIDSIRKKFEMLNFVNMWLVSFCTICFVSLYQPFMYVWVGNDMMLSMGMAILFSMYFFITTIQRIVIVYKDAAGVWKEDMIRCYASCAINIILNIISVKYIGLYGVIGSSVFVGMFIDPWMARTVHRVILKKSARQFYFNFIKDIIVCCISCFIAYMICLKIPYSWLGIILRTAICCIVGNIVLTVVYHNDYRFTGAKQWIQGLLRRFIKCKR